MSMRRTFSVSAILALALACTGPAFAIDSAAGVIDDLASRAKEMQTAATLSPEDQQQRFRALLVEDFDFGTISRLVLGRFWEAASPAERQQFAAAFQNYIVGVYAERFKDIAGASLKVTRERRETADSTLVTTDMVSEDGAPPLKIDWRLGRTGEGYKIIDVSVEGVSMTLAQREEFSSVIQRNGGQVSGLIQTLRAKAATAAAQ